MSHVHHIKPLLGLLPELYDMVKTAKVQEPYLTSDKETTLLSAVAIEYAKLPGVESCPVGLEKIAQVNRAVELYGLGGQVKEYTDSLHSRYQGDASGTGLTKEAAQELTLAERVLEERLDQMVDIEKVASQCQALYASYGDSISSEKVLRHAGVGFLDKEAAVRNLECRLRITGNEEFGKIAQVLTHLETPETTRHGIVAIGNAVAALDKKAGLMGMDFFEECVLTKVAAVASAMKVSLGGKTVSIERVMSIAPDLTDVLGADVVKELTGDPATAKAVLESLPSDLKAIVARYA
jgi:hypothetical protein